MHTSGGSVSLVELSAAGIRMRPVEAVTIVRELIRQVVAGEAAGVPSAHVIRLAPDGRVLVEGPVAAGEPSVVRAAQLLDSLLQADQVGESRIPGSLKLVLARGLGTLDLPPFESLAAFADALERFAATEPEAVVADVVARRRAVVTAQPGGNPPARDTTAAQSALVEPFAKVEGAPRTAAPPRTLTISDIRRARRAGGLSLGDISGRSGIPVELLRQLEWGFLLNWPLGAQGQGMLVRYARAAGLDEQLVVGIVTPLVKQTAPLRALFASGVATAETAGSRPPVALAHRSLRPVEPPTRHRRGWGRVAAVTLLLAGAAAAWALTRGELSQGWPMAARPAHVASSGTDASDAVEGVVSPGTHDETPAATGPDTPASDTSGRSSQRAAATPIDVPPDDGGGRVNDPGTSARPRAVADDATRVGAGGPDDRAAASVGAAVFHMPTGDEVRAVGVSGTTIGGAVLHITRIVDDAANNSHVRPSPDGRYIAFDSDRHGERAVYVADADGQNVRRVSPDGFAAMPSWSPDGARLAFVRAEPGRPDVWNLWTLDRDTGELRQVTGHARGQPQGGSWFPTGDRIAYSVADRLILVDLHTGAERAFAPPRPGREVRSPAVSPDGRRVVFQVVGDGTWLLEVGNGSMRRVLDDPTSGEYAWSPDGTQLAYHSARSGGWGVFVMAPR